MSMFREKELVPNITLIQRGPQKHETNKSQEFIHVRCFMYRLFTFSGLILDRAGLFASRIATAVPMTIGLIMMIFVQNRVVFEAGTYMIAIAAIGVLITNLTVQDRGLGGV